MNIVVIGRCLPDDNSSYGKFEYEQARGLSNRGHKVCYLFSDNRSIRAVHAIKSVDHSRDGIRIVGGMVPFGGIPYRTLCFLKTRILSRAFSIIVSKHMKPDVVYVHFPLISMTPQFFEELVARGVPVVTMEHWTKVRNKTIDRRRRKFLGDIVEKASEVCCVSQDLAVSISELTDAPDRMIRVIPNAVGTDYFYYSANRSHKAALQYIYSGRLEKNKSVDLILQALSQVEYPWVLTVAGAGSQEQALKRLANKLGISAYVNFTGWTSPDRLGELYRNSDVFISASVDETFCVPFAEAWMCGLPCIGASSNPLRKYFTEWNGALFEDDCIESLRIQLEYVWSHKSLYNRKSIAGWAKDNFSSSEVMLQVEDILSFAVKRGRPFDEDGK